VVARIKIEGKGKIVPELLNEHHAMKAYWGSVRIAPCILDLGIRWRGVVSFTLWPLYSQGRNLGGPQSRS